MTRPRETGGGHAYIALEGSGRQPRPRRRLSESTLAFLPAVAAAAVGLVIALSLPPDAPGADPANYLLLATLWAEGEWSRALNGYWSPLVPMLLAPAASLGWTSHRALALLGVGVAVIAVLALQRLMRVLAVDRRTALWWALGSVPLVSVAAFGDVVPDVLMSALLLAFVADLLDDRAPPARTGLLGALAFLAKSYALPVAAVSLVSVALLRRMAGAAPIETRAPLRALAWLILCSLVWIVPVSLQAGRPTIGSAAAYNRVVTAPGARGIAYDWAGLIEPTRPGAFWAWEDPSALPVGSPADEPPYRARPSGVDGKPSAVTGDARAPTGAPGPGDGRLRRVVDNAWKVVRNATLVPVPSVLALIGILLAARACAPTRVRATGSSREAARVLEAGLIVAIHVSGLLLLIVITRYLLFPMLMAVALSARVASGPIGASRRGGAVALVLAVTIGLPPVPWLAERRPSIEARAALFEFLDSVEGGLSHARLASIPAALSAVGAVCLRADCVYLGAPRARAGRALSVELRTAGATHLLTSDEVKTEVERRIVRSMRRYEPRGDQPGYVLYTLK